jgi:hypothetical protein
MIAARARPALVASLIAATAAPPLAAAGPEAADLVARANQARAELDFDRAVDLLERAEATGQNRRDELVVIYRSLAESHAALSRSERAEAGFRRLLALAPDTALPAGSSPKLTFPFNAARAFIRERGPLAVRCDRRGRGAVLSILSDPVDLVAAARPARADGTPLGGPQRRPGRAAVPIPVPAGAPRDLTCAALDKHGNELARVPLLSDPARASAADPTEILPPGAAARAGAPPRRSGEPARDVTEPPTLSPPLFARWWPWGPAALLAAGTAAYFTIQVGEDEEEWESILANSDEPLPAGADDVRERGERHARYSNIAYGAAAALAAVSVALLVRDIVRARGNRRGREVDASAGAAPLPGTGAAVTLILSF